MPSKDLNRNYSALIVDDVHPVLMQELELEGISCSYEPTIQAAEVADALVGHQILVVRSKIHVDRALMRSNPQLKLIARAGSGMDNIDLEAATQAGIICVNAPEGNRDAVAEQCLGMLLSLLANIHSSYLEVRELKWNRESNRGRELKGLTVGIIGYGNTGSAVAERLNGFGVRICVYDKYKSGFGNETVEECSLERLLELADVLTFHVPLTEDTRGWIDHRLINKMGKSFYLMNLSRGGIMNMADIADGLNRGKILGFAADVLEKEPPSLMEQKDLDILWELLKRPNVLVTPHVGGWTFESYRKISEVLASKILSTLHEMNEV